MASVRYSVGVYIAEHLGSSGDSDLSFLNSYEHYNPQIYPVRAPYRGPRSSEEISFESAAVDYDISLVNEFVSGIKSQLDERQALIKSGDSILSGATYKKNNEPERSIHIKGIDDLGARIDALMVRVKYLMDQI